MKRKIIGPTGQTYVPYIKTYIPIALNGFYLEAHLRQLLELVCYIEARCVYEFASLQERPITAKPSKLVVQHAFSGTE